MSQTPLLFVDRDGTLIAEPEDFQIDSYAKLRFVDGVIPAMLRLRDAGYQFVMISNQDGLGSEAFPREDFEGPHALMLQVFASQGIVFRDVLIDTSLPADNAPTRKPAIGLALPLLKDRGIDWTRTAMVGDRDTDIAFARNLGVRGFQLRTDSFGGEWDWAGIAHALADAPRTARIQRNTRETRIEVGVDLDREADPSVSTGLGFFDHMLEQLGKHGGFALELKCQGDLHIDEHHTIEDSALALGQALRAALGDKRGIGRYGFVLPMDESLATAALDFSGRPYFVFEGAFARERVGDMPTELVPHFFRSLCETAGLNLNLNVQGENDHHKVEACFKAVARALRQAIRREGHGLPSTKGTL
ncbi:MULTISPECIES: bifunctional histidinol-phosphatase/imidazoleglycerol-phosphate dehydratase HisB [unclassified Lysobacter]|uniref:bifunctional histidinol-phosphatase/imidazoleglycerol-phosphate dehydratase HisB n=1 Tax=unclassified Lysobacter TaxID=2635362 RepID=UPI0006F544C1|nr:MULTISPECIES: bifunctional histidinol-phosphatase/imidazoleglycerol-phosphate dehydratase HisB [unclassified Lysobacter]KRA20313.1 imidazoleglycerol-phosphate dehydratase [Lysobacter sp. Root604]KRD39324.1 imidazoleglycerol-phosphate dehydratase [Lysobacter sp. Root916]KRD74532.1 imidazoleglycerol-phosphate dehydratase [Lysobacter sp. Root983]